MVRVRERKLSATYKFLSNQIVSLQTEYVSERIREVSAYGGTNVVHTKIKPFDDIFRVVPTKAPTAPPQLVGVYNWFFGLTPEIIADLLTPYIQQYSNSLVWKNLPSSNKLGLIQLIAEFDQTLAMFTQRVSYLGFRYGWTPFISDLTAICQQLMRLQSAMESTAQYASRQKVPVVVTTQRLDFARYHDVVLNGSMQILQRGRVSFSDDMFTSAKRFLDILGFHPDLQTAWDLVPFSFVIDWVLPISNHLANAKSRGWISSLPFAGWSSTKFTGSASSKYSGYPGKVEVSYYSRNRTVDVLDIRNQVPLDTSIKLPNAFNLVDGVALALQAWQKRR